MWAEVGCRTDFIGKIFLYAKVSEQRVSKANGDTIEDEKFSDSSQVARIFIFHAILNQIYFILIASPAIDEPQTSNG